MKLSNFRSSISKDKDGKYRVNYSYRAKDGTRKRTCKRGFLLMREATKWQTAELPKLIAQLEADEGADSIDPEEVMTMGELIEEYLEDSKINKRNSTYANKANIFKTKITPYFGKMRVREVSTNDIRKWHNNIKQQRTDDGKEYSPTYIHTIANQLSALFNYAVAFHGLEKNPVRVAKMSMKFGKKTAKETPFWTLEEYLKFSNEIKDKPEFYYAFQVFFWCGIRLGELLALTKADVDCDAMTLNIANSYSAAEQELGETKTESSVRIVHMPKELAEEMREYMDSLYSLKDSDVIFPLTKSSLHREMTRGATAAGVKRITLHGLRHSHISMLMNYVSIASTVDIASRAGHKKPDITMIYAHRYSNKDELIAQQLDAMMKGGTESVGEKL